MLDETVEPACRAVEKAAVPRLDKCLPTRVNSKIEQKQLENCNLSFSDITKIKAAFVQILAGYYHSRTKYPDQKDPDGQQQTAAVESTAAAGEDHPQEQVQQNAASSSQEDKAEAKKNVTKTSERKSLKEKAEKVARSAGEKKGKAE